jgi:1-aminocyclopropane-1-carboxylate deaminase
MLEYQQTPLFEISTAETEKAGVHVIVKREDLNHSHISGNKWWKLKYNLEQAAKAGYKTILTFGGAFSNHIYATSAAAKEAGLQSVGIIRGEETLPLNHTLQFAREQGMTLHYVTRESYSNKSDEKFGDFYLIPEGGTNELAIRGCSEFAASQLSQIPFDYLVMPVGTGGTMAGILSGLRGQKKVIGVAVLKNGDFLKKEVDSLVRNFSDSQYGNWHLLTSYHHGGYARVTPALTEFIVMMNEAHNLPLDHVYTGKMMFALMEEIKKGTFKRGSVILALHTGGLQGSLR